MNRKFAKTVVKFLFSGEIKLSRYWKIKFFSYISVFTALFWTRQNSKSCRRTIKTLLNKFSRAFELEIFRSQFPRHFTRDFVCDRLQKVNLRGFLTLNLELEGIEEIRVNDFHCWTWAKIITSKVLPPNLYKSCKRLSEFWSPISPVRETDHFPLAEKHSHWKLNKIFFNFIALDVKVVITDFEYCISVVQKFWKLTKLRRKTRHEGPVTFIFL